MQHAPSFADVQNVKRHAKTLKATHPELPHGKRLDLAAADLLGVRNYHELSRRFKAVIDQHLEIPEGLNVVAYCRYCHYRFAPELKEDQLEHREFHERIMEAEESCGFRPMTAVQRDLQRLKGYDLVHRAATLEERVEGAILLLRALFDRSFANAIDAGLWRKHPSFEQFAAMMNPYVEERYPDLAPVMAQRFGRIPGVIPLGQNYWPLK